MNLQPVKTAAGCRLRDPKTKKVLPNVADPDAKAVSVDLDDPHWYRAHNNGDIVIIKPEVAPAAPAPAVVAPSVPATAAPAAPIAPAPTAAVVAAPVTSTKTV